MYCILCTIDIGSYVHEMDLLFQASPSVLLSSKDYWRYEDIKCRIYAPHKQILELYVFQMSRALMLYIRFEPFYILRTYLFRATCGFCLLPMKKNDVFNVQM